MENSLGTNLDAFAARRVQKLTQRVTWLSDHLGLSEPTIVDAAYLRQVA